METSSFGRVTSAGCARKYRFRRLIGLSRGYYEQTGRASTELTAFDYERVRDLPPLPSEGTHTDTEMWRNITYFLKAARIPSKT